MIPPSEIADDERANEETAKVGATPPPRSTRNVPLRCLDLTLERASMPASPRNVRFTETPPQGAGRMQMQYRLQRSIS
ncbi:hypothetical protein COOONC_09489 [Cooperia oncophora]